MKNQSKIVVFIISTIIFIGLDRVSKNWAKAHLFYQRSKAYLNGVFTLDYAENKGAALSFGSDLPENQAFWVLEVGPAIILFLLLVYIFKNISKWNTFSMVSFAAIFAGGAANLVDRFLNNRHVIDFMIIDVGGFHTGIFNVADVCISAGVVGMLIGNFYSKRVL
jgi:signal peptidase II